MTVDEQLDLIDEVMSPIVDRFNMNVRERRFTKYYVNARYANATTVLEVAVDWRELRPFLKVYSVVDSCAGIDQSHCGIELNDQGCDVDAILMVRGVHPTPVGKMLPNHDLGPLRRLLGEYASALERHAADVLEGDFSVVADVKKLMRQQRQEP